jgi:hypothetical protein
MGNADLERAQTFYKRLQDFIPRYRRVVPSFLLVFVRFAQFKDEILAHH